MPQAGAKRLIDGDEPAFAILEEHALREVIEESLFRRRGCGRGDDGWHETIPLGETSKSWRTNAYGKIAKTRGMRFCPRHPGAAAPRPSTRVARICGRCKRFGISLPIIVAMA